MNRKGLEKEDKRKIVLMRKRGLSYKEIEARVGISKNTIKSYCQRNNIGIEIKEDIVGKCKNCNTDIENASRGTKKKFCSEKCRREWWKENSFLYNRTAFYSIKCKFCGKVFKSYGNKGRKYCCHECYIRDRFRR